MLSRHFIVPGQYPEWPFNPGSEYNYNKLVYSTLLPLIILSKIAMTAKTRRICINPPALSTRNPIAQAMTRSIAMMYRRVFMLFYCYSKTIRRTIITITAAPEMYMPPEMSLRRVRIDFTSFLRFFFSEELSFDLSIALISSSLPMSTFASWLSPGLGAGTEVVVFSFSPAYVDWTGKNVIDKNARLKQRISFFILRKF